MMKSGHRFPVAIIGGGPVGAFISRICESYGIHHVLIEKRRTPTLHPQAHYLNARSLEVLQNEASDIFRHVCLESISAAYWKDFVYAYRLNGREFFRMDHFAPHYTPKEFWLQTPANVIHIPQNILETLFRKSVNTEDKYDSLSGKDSAFTTIKGSKYLIGFQMDNLKRIPDGFEIDVSPTNSSLQSTIWSKYLIAADGANSPVRNILGIPMIGPEKLQTMLNVHFICKDLLKVLKKREAMLYLVFNEDVVAVFVAHNIVTGEWVCQIPIFPPFQNPQDFDESRILDLLRKAIGVEGLSPLALAIQSVRVWTMHAQVAQSFVQAPRPAIDKTTGEAADGTGFAFLVGDAAHRFPPAGGFGLNTGLQDAHNLVWKLALVERKLADSKLLYTYHDERHPVAAANCELSVRNYQRTTAAARALGVDPAHANLLVNSANNPVSNALIPSSVREAAVNAALKLGLAPLRLLREPGGPTESFVASLGRLLRGDGNRQAGRAKGGLPLIFPEQDIDFRYSSGALLDDTNVSGRPQSKPHAQSQFQGVSGKEGEGDYQLPRLRVGARVPHCWLAIPPSHSKSSTPRHVLSTLFLASMMRESRHESSSSLSLVLIVSRRKIDAWTAAIRRCHENGVRSATSLVCIDELKVGGEIKALDHELVQYLLQSPRHGPQPSNNVVESQPEQLLFITKALLGAEYDAMKDKEIMFQYQDAVRSEVMSILKSQVDPHPDNQCCPLIPELSLIDVTGRWAAFLQSMQVSQGNNRVDWDDVGVFVRPDDHVAGIAQLSSRDTFEDLVKERVDSLNRMSRALHLI